MDITLDFATICRICLEDGGMFSIFEANDNMLLADKIMLCSSIQISEGDEFPSRICSVCNSMLGIALDFKNKCELSDTTLRNYVASRTECLKNDFEVDSKELEYYNVNYEVDYAVNNCDSNRSDDDVKPKIEIQDEDDLPLLKIRLTNDISNLRTKKVKKKRKQKGNIDKITPKIKISKNPNNIATSILEGVFKWDGNRWRHVKRNKRTVIPEKEDSDDGSPVIRLPSKILRAKQREIRKALKLKLKKEKQKVVTPTLCDHCGEQFNSKWRLSDHIRQKHIAKKIILKCAFPGCKKLFNSNYYRSRHEKRIHSENKDFVCTQCGRQFAFKNELITHTKKHDPEKYPKKLRKCKYCPQTYKTQKSTDIHERSVHTGERPAICKICEAAFFHEDYLKEHTRLHTGETPFKCPICGRGYAQRCNMKSHLRIHKVSELDEKIKLKMKPNYLKLLRD